MITEQASALLQSQSQAVTDGELDRAHELLDQLHRRWHDTASVHLRVHWRWMALYRSEGRYSRAAFELLALIFAAPASWVQRYLGLARAGVASADEKK